MLLTSRFNSSDILNYKNAIYSICVQAIHNILPKSLPQAPTPIWKLSVPQEMQLQVMKSAKRFLFS